MIGYVYRAGHSGWGPLPFEEKWQIAPASSVEIQLIFGPVSNRPVSPLDADSIRIVFDGCRELTYRNIHADAGETVPIGIYDLTRYIETEIDKRHGHFAYVITDDDYEQSVPIAAGPEAPPREQ